MHIAIIGPGLIGRSVALAARRADPATKITEIDRGESIAVVPGPDLIVLATPVDAILDIIRTHADVLRASVAVDTGSTKRAIVAAAGEAGLTSFVGGHPMAGTTASGPSSARADLFDDRPWFLVTGQASAVAVSRVRTFVESLGARPVTLTDDGDEHDRVMAAVSHLPQLVASALMIVVAQAAGDGLRWSGPGLHDTTRLAGSGAAMWQSIADTNADQLRPLLRTMARQLDTLADRLSDGRHVSALLDEAQRVRALLQGPESPG